ncbi:hypothetical protein ACFLV7_08070 [Chloroflexota bacterium]
MFETGDGGVEIFDACTVGDNGFVGSCILIDVAVRVGPKDGVVVAGGCTAVGGFNVVGEVGTRVDLAVGAGSDEAIAHAPNTRAVHAVTKVIQKLRTILGSTVDGGFIPVNIRIVISNNVRAIIDRSMSACLLEEVYTESCGFVQLFEIL